MSRREKSQSHVTRLSGPCCRSTILVDNPFILPSSLTPSPPLYRSITTTVASSTYRHLIKNSGDFLFHCVGRIWVKFAGINSNWGENVRFIPSISPSPPFAALFSAVVLLFFHRSRRVAPPYQFSPSYALALQVFNPSPHPAFPSPLLPSVQYSLAYLFKQKHWSTHAFGGT